MHTSGDSTANTVPAFLTKLWTLVDDPNTNELICWDNSGKSFHVSDQARFAKEILPLYFKHNNMASFIRQLNMYGFRKVVRAEPMYLKAEKDDVEFAHQFFLQGQENLLEFIKRKVAGVSKLLEEAQRRERSSLVLDTAANEEDLHKVFAEVHYIKNKQDSMTSRLENLKIENEMLWREVATLRQQHSNQSQVVKKLISFLLSLLGNKRTTISGMKRKIPLMLEAGDASTSDASVLSPPKISRRTVLPSRDTYRIQSPIQGDASKQYVDDKLLIQEVFDTPTITLAESPISSTSTALHSDVYTDLPLEPLALLSDDDIATNVELTDLLDTTDPVEVLYGGESSAVSGESSVLGGESSAVGGDSSALGGNSPLAATVLPTTSTLPQRSVPNRGSSVSTDKGVWDAKQPSSKVTTLALSNPVLNTGEFDKADLSRQLDTLQANLDTIQEIFSCGQYNFDSNTLFGMYDLGIPGLYEENSTEHSDLLADSKAGILGNEVIQYVPQDDFSTLFQDISELNTPYPTLDDTEPIYPDLSTADQILLTPSSLLPATTTTTSQTFVLSSTPASSTMTRNDHRIDPTSLLPK